jgi:hypothetical protein
MGVAALHGVAQEPGVTTASGGVEVDGMKKRALWLGVAALLVVSLLGAIQPGQTEAHTGWHNYGSAFCYSGSYWQPQRYAYWHGSYHTWGFSVRKVWIAPCAFGG